MNFVDYWGLCGDDLPLGDVNAPFINLPPSEQGGSSNISIDAGGREDPSKTPSPGEESPTPTAGDTIFDIGGGGWVGGTITF